MNKPTLLQFDGERTASACGLCGQHFSGDARFCPFDGEPLTAAPGWDPARDPLLGSVIDDRYAVEGVLGEGGMGTVYQVRHTSLGRSFALKVLRRDLAEDTDLAPRFTQEAKAAASIAHPHVVQITDFGALPSGQPYFVMELVEGRPLGHIVRESGRLSAARAANIARQVAEALAAAHASGVVHRDLKPDNVQVVPSPTGDIVKVLDFGLAKVAGTSRFTRKGMVFGTPHYMSPEQAAGEPADHRVDIYALGIVLYEMLTGRLPFEADSFMGVLAKHLYELPDAPSRVAGTSGTEASLDAIVMRCLEKKPDHRYAAMGEVVLALSNVAPPQLSEPAPPTSSEKFEGEPMTFDAGPMSARPARRPLVWLVALGAGAGLGLAYTAYSSVRAEPEVAASPASGSALATAPPSAAPLLEPAPSATTLAPPTLGEGLVGSAPAPTERKDAPASGPKPSSTGAAAAAPTPRAKPPKGPAFSGSDIVNPWGE